MARGGHRLDAGRVDIATTGAWRIYDSAFTSVASGTGSSQAVLPAASGLAYVILFGDPALTIAVTVSGGDGRPAAK